MASEMSPVNELFITHAVGAGLFASRSELLDAAVSLLRCEEETLAAIREGLASIDEGQGMDLDQADLAWRQKHGFRRGE